MENLPKILRDLLKGALRLGVLGIGSELRSDDAAGILVVERLEKSGPGKDKEQSFRTFRGGTAPENITGEIKRFKPTHLVIVDAADLAKAPGEAAIFGPEDDLGALSFSTHRMPIKIMADYLKGSFECKVIMIGIQPKSLVFGEGCCREVRETAEAVAALIKEVVYANA